MTVCALHPGRTVGRALLLATLTLALQGCDRDAILEVTDPDIITPPALDNAAGAAALRAGAVGDFAFAKDGNNGGQEGIVLVGGLMTDEYMHSGTFPTRQEYAARNSDTRNTSLLPVFRNLHRAREAAERAAVALKKFATNPAADPRIGEMYALAGYTYIFIGESYCSGVPFSTSEGGIDYGVPLSTTEIFSEALERFDSALVYTGGSASILNLARVGEGRALLNQGQYAQAATAVAAVPTNFSSVTEHSITTGRQENGLHTFNWLSKRWSVADQEGGNGLNFRTAGDPRVVAQRVPSNNVGFDASTEQYDLLKYPTRSSSSLLAGGIEARLIEAEAFLQAGDVPNWLARLNAARATIAGLADLTDPGTQVARENLMFRERAFWFFADGHRLGDMRRLIRQYGRGAETVFPTGVYFKGGDFGTDVNLPVPFDEENNPEYDPTVCDKAAA